MSEQNTIIDEFIASVNWAFQCWQLHKFLFDENKNPGIMKQEFNYFFTLLSAITQEYSILQIAKLHDPAIQRKNKNLSLDYIIEHINWPHEVLEKLHRLKSQMAMLCDAIAPARNKAITHSDLESILMKTNVGSFERGTDDKYFESLLSFAKIVYKAFYNKNLNFEFSAKQEVEKFISYINKINITPTASPA